MAVKIPQNVDIEDKLVGPLTLKQFLYVLGGGALIFIAYQYCAEGYLFFAEFVIITTLISGLVIALAFIKINGQPFIKFILNMLAYIFIPKLRFWKPQNKIRAKKIKMGDWKTRDQSKIQPALETDHGKVEKLARILDTGGKINSEENANDAHEINTVEQNKDNPQTIEANLEVEDILIDTEN